jgi:hypothetical protein
MITSTDLVLESTMETQLKLKILYSYSHLSDKENGLIMKSNKSLRRIFLVLIYSIVFKKVLSSKMNNRIVTNYFKKFSTYSINKEYSYGQKNKNLFELEYINTLSINSLYELSIVRSDYETYW